MQTDFEMYVPVKPRPPRKQPRDISAIAPVIAQRYRDGALIDDLQVEFRCCYNLVVRAIKLHIPQEEFDAIRHERLTRGGRETRFKPGQKPIFVAPKGSHLSPATEFKKGHVPATAKPLGSIEIRNDKCGKQFRWIATPGKSPVCHKWIPYARYVYEQNYCQVPAGLFVVHLDGDTMNDEPSNLKAVDNAGHLALQLARDPGMLARCRQKAGEVTRARHARNRILKARSAELAGENETLL